MSDLIFLEQSGLSCEVHVGFNNSDKNYGPVLYSRDLLLCDEKGTYMHTAKPKDLIPQEVGMSCPSWQWHRTEYRWSPVRTLLVVPL